MTTIMKIQPILPRAALVAAPALAITGALLLCAPTKAYSFIGGSLNLTQRDIRVCNNFTDPTANDNTTPDSQFPGFTGCRMAFWKSCVEWGSEAHGTGGGDPSQPVLGSGGANFDAAWGGSATSGGNTNDNIFSELAGSSGGVLAFTETPISDGWRILFYSGWEWHDGPAGIPANGNSFDMQGVGCHEYGHALGLGHESNQGPVTMYPSTASGDIAARSIEADDINGIRALYGVKAANKPHISSIWGGAQLVIQGTNFPTNNNAEVWFTFLNPTNPGQGMPLKVTGLSSNGTEITVSVPSPAGPGDIMVRDGLSSANQALSNAFPFDPTACPQPLTYCSSKVTSLGTTPIVDFLGSNSLAQNNLAIECHDAMPSKPGLIFYSDAGPYNVPFQGGTLCVKPPISRTPVFVFDIFGYYMQSLPFTVFDIGITRHYQFWFRDPQHPDGTGVGLSNAGRVTFCF
jgi:matrixin